MITKTGKKRWDVNTLKELVKTIDLNPSSKGLDSYRTFVQHLSCWRWQPSKQIIEKTRYFAGVRSEASFLSMISC